MVTEASTEMSAVVIGGSAGSTAALGIILPLLPRDFIAPIFLVVHVPKDSPNLVVDLLRSQTSLPLREVEDKSRIDPGVIYVAPPDYHVLVEANGVLSLSVSAPVHYARPSIDVLFESAAAVYGPRLVGVLLSGANEDGALGLEEIRRCGGQTLVQDPATSQMPTMPASAIRRGAVQHALSPEGLGRFLADASTGTAGGHP